MNRAWFALLVGALAVAAAVRIYKWIDEGGTVHYSDQPPPLGGEGEALELPPAPPERDVRKARERLEALRAELTQGGAGRPKRRKTARCRHSSPLQQGHLKPGEAMAALEEGPADEFYRWGQEICGELEQGTDRESIVGNLANFWGPDLSTALVGASLEVICPDLR
jgi:hypothetical protein